MKKLIMTIIMVIMGTITAPIPYRNNVIRMDRGGRYRW